MSLFNRKKRTFIKQYETERLYLCVLGPEWAEEALSYYVRNKDFLKEWEPDRDLYFYTRAGQINQLKYELQEYQAHNMVRLWIFKKGNESKAIGNLCFTNIVYGNFQSCFLGYKLDHNEINKGYMTEAVRKGIEIMFKEHGLHRVEVNIIPRNLPSLRVVEKLNLEKEGFSKRYLMINNVWEDHLHFAAYNDLTL
jgi:[ribosomal protein S5]-alanine N-acetyltransferase